MGKRGPGANRHRKQAPAAQVLNAPWERADIPDDERVLAFLRSLPVVSGLRAGKKLELLPFQEQFVRSVYGPKGPDGKRKIRLAGLSVARGNGKSALLAGLSLAHLVGPMAERYGEIYAAAIDREQAGKLYALTIQYISEVDWIAARVNIRDWHKDITDTVTGSVWRALTADARKAHGLAPSFWVADEVAQWRSRDLWDGLVTGMIKRDQPLGVTISTQAASDHHFWSELLDSEPEPHVYMQLHAAPKGCEIMDREAWAAANPALGHFVSDAQIKAEAKRAVSMRSAEPAFRLYNLNQRIDAKDRFVSEADWNLNGGEVDESALMGEDCYGGLDLSSTRDLTALALYFPAHGVLKVWHWAPAETIRERALADKVPYDLWAKQGWIIETPGRATDRVAIVRQLEGILSRYNLVSMAYDAWRFEDLQHELRRHEVEIPLQSFRAGYKTYSPAMDAFERALIEGRLRHGDNPVLRWQAANLQIEYNHTTGDRKPTKRNPANRIDGMVAAIMAVSIAGTPVEAKTPSFQLLIF